MLKYRQNIKHHWQGNKGNCGPIALACLFESSVEDLEKIVKCTSKGTYTENVFFGMKTEGIDCSLVSLREEVGNHLWWIKLLSCQRPVYAGCNFINQGKRGRPSNGHHAVLFANGMCYDGHNLREEPIDAIVTKFNKNLIIKDLVIFHHELTDWKKNLEEMD